MIAKRQAIAHGMAMTRKYAGVLVLAVALFLAFEIVRGVMSYASGRPLIDKTDLDGLYKDASKRDHLYQDLQGAGYVDGSGWVQEKLQDLAPAQEVSLPPVWAPDHAMINAFLQIYRYRLPFPKIIFYGLTVFFLLGGMLLQLGLVRISLAAARDEAPTLKDFWGQGQYLNVYLLSTMVYFLAVLGGAVCLIVPGIILAITLSLNGYFIVDQQMGPVQALGASRDVTRGARWQLFLLGILLVLFNLLGFLCLAIGLLWTVPASLVAVAWVYDQLLKQE